MTGDDLSDAGGYKQSLKSAVRGPLGTRGPRISERVLSRLHITEAQNPVPMVDVDAEAQDRPLSLKERF